MVRRLDQILERAEPWAGSAQKQLIINARQAVDQYVRQKMNEAHQWYLALEDDFSKGAIVRVAEKLKSQPSFLQETDKSKLADLADRLQRQMDKDIIMQIEAQFRQITDRTLRQQCIDRLRQIMDE